MRLISAVWSTIRRLISSGTRISKQRLPASIWKIGTLRRLAGITERQLLVSPNTSRASGVSVTSVASTAAMILPIISAALPPAAFKKWSGLRMPRSSKKIWFNS
ncbi:hypothetical protein D3C71_1645900 [compost metagenome]